jgi:TolB-like protein/Tfp pilus assembly protein PilF
VPASAREPHGTIAAGPNGAAKPLSNAAMPASSAAGPPSNAAKPPSSAAKPLSNAAKPPSNAAKPPSSAAKPLSNAAKPLSNAAKPLSNAAKPSPEAVRAQLDKILASQTFAGAVRPARFLRFIVEQALEGHQLKETLVGVEVFGRKPGYDPRLDGVVRVEAVKLRSRLKDYYETEGALSPVRIDLPKGGYLPCFGALPDPPAGPAEPAAPVQRLETIAAPPRRAWWTDWRVMAPPLALALLIAGFVLARRIHPRPVTPDSSSIAVLPFVNLSSNKENEYFSDGLTDDLINALAKVRGLRVVARGSAFQFKGKNPDIRAVGRQLNVAAVLEGSVQRSGGRLRITAQLSSVGDGYHVWSETYDRRLADVFAVQDEISRAIVGALEVRVAGNPDRLVQTSTQDLEAYNLYLQGRFHLNKWRPEGARKGIEYFTQAIAKDPGYAPAYTGLADCYTWLGVFGWTAARQAMPQARQAANRALQLDETLAAAHVSLGYVKAMYDWDWPGAQREFQRALQLSPGDADAHFAYSVTYLTPLGRLDEALAEIRRALALDPLSPYKITAAGMIYTDRREYDRAVEQYRKAIELDPAFYQAYDELRAVETVRGRPRAEDAVIQSMRAAFLNVDDTSARARLAAQQGRQAEARGLVEHWIQGCIRTGRPGKSCYAAQIYASIGEKDLAFHWLDQAYEERNPLLAYAKVMPYYDNLRPDPRFRGLLHRLGLE